MPEINTSVLIWTIINFCILLFALGKVMWKPLLKMLATREQEVAGNLARAEEAKQASEKMRQDLTDELAKAETKARDIITQAMSEAEAARQQTLGRAQSEADHLLEKAQETISREKDRALAELREEVAGLAVEAAAKVVGKVMTPDDHRRLMNDAVREVGDGH